MGLDITWYRGLTESPNEPREECGEIVDYDNATDFYIQAPWADYAKEFKDDMAYRWEESDCFRAGSYGGYGQFRDILRGVGGFNALSWYATPNGGQKTDDERCSTLPFYHLVCFSDCEGTIGTSACAKLAKDFDDMREKFMGEIGSHDGTMRDYYEGKYNEWANACKQASDHGAIRFH